MCRWNIKASGLFVLSCVIILMLLNAGWPGVDLPDAAFNCGTAPVVVHAHGTTAPRLVVFAITLPIPDALQALRILQWSALILTSPRPNFRPILLRSIRC